MKTKTFIPKELLGLQSMFSFGSVSLMYWDLACELESKAQKELTEQWNSKYVFAC